MVSLPPRGQQSARQDSNLQGLAAWGAGRLRRRPAGLRTIARGVEPSEGSTPEEGRLAIRSPRAHSSRGRDRTCDFLLNRQAAYHSRTLKWSPSTDLNGPLAGTGRARRHLRLRGGSRGPCCTGRQRRGYEHPPGNYVHPPCRNRVGSGRLCRTRTIVGRFGNPLRVSIRTRAGTPTPSSGLRNRRVTNYASQARFRPPRPPRSGAGATAIRIEHRAGVEPASLAWKARS